ncbi:MerR family transcriptional regulator [Gordonia sp. ABSL49_1]|uniref:MerR family transcriptional regulator n=1 Tax=Gordonia sp. ABSL49_1 TaxID=2920941 RepID=UPI001F0E40AF|nr:MerR family transcriptional regulator [Gordonia sp. ABSL49_1]MCH5644678.1 MerR family transcriptional regulator [Gordonia sp. ABSL49_1]
MARTTPQRLKQLAAIIDQLSGAPAYVGKQSRELESSVTKLVTNATRQTLGHSRSERYRIDDLARITGVTTRNIRAYRERGLLPAPHRVGRVTLYSDAHVTRLSLISSMLSRGYQIAHIDELLSAHQSGRQISDILGLEAEFSEPVAQNPHTTLSDLATDGVDGDAARRLARLGLITIGRGDVTVNEPAVVEAILALATEARPVSAVLDTVEKVAPAFDALSTALTDAADALAQSGPDPDSTHPDRAHPDSAHPDSDERVADVTLSLVRLRALADAATRSALNRVTNELLTQLLSQPPDEHEHTDSSPAPT